MQPDSQALSYPVFQVAVPPDVWSLDFVFCDTAGDGGAFPPPGPAATPAVPILNCCAAHMQARTIIVALWTTTFQ